MSGTTNGRELVLDILLDVDKNGSYSHLAIHKTLKQYQYLDKQTRAFITRLSEGTIEYRLQLDYILNQFSKIKVNKMKPIIRNILRMSLYQLRFMSGVPDSAVCNEAVALTKKRGFQKLSGFVNGNLRNIIRNKDAIVWPNPQQNPIQALSVQYSMPEWIVEEWMEAYGIEQTERILTAILADTDTVIRCNESKITKEELKKKLEEEGVCVADGNYVENALKISGYNYLGRLKAFKEGNFVIQDESSMLVGLIADFKEGDQIIDVCASPGGKSFHAADLLMNSGHVIARDLTAYKVELMEENQERLKFQNITIEQQDALEFVEADLESADVVLADLPCSGLGIMARKNDIKYRITKEQQRELSKLQREILSVVNQYVKPGGVLIYSTCTINPEENEKNVEWFISQYPFELETIDPFLIKELQSETTKKGYLQLFPGIHQCDGFFIARLRRK